MLSAPPSSSNPSVPRNGVPLPNINPYPSTQKPIVETANTMKFLDRMFVEFFTRQKPVSTHAKPRFMKNTSIAVINVHIVSATIFGSMRPSYVRVTFLKIVLLSFPGLEVIDHLRGNRVLVVGEAFVPTKHLLIGLVVSVLEPGQHVLVQLP